ncbi:hypothetical protein [Metabacillus sp. RGM 3146]|uniref:hypothetical protein n=1 Tax=Metabacillus sp. RGM 3146 TaxID=3401092 RepID=UPI003B9D2EFF
MKTDLSTKKTADWYQQSLLLDFSQRLLFFVQALITHSAKASGHLFLKNIALPMVC